MSPPFDNILQLLADGSDMELVFDAVDHTKDPQVVAGHVSVLRLWSKVLRDAIDTENISNSAAGKISIPMPGTSKEDWLSIMEFIYPVTPPPVISWDNLEMMLKVADKYCMSGLIPRLGAFLQQNNVFLSLNPESNMFVWKWVYVADRHMLFDIAKQCIDVQTDLPEVLKCCPLRQSPIYMDHKLSEEVLQHLVIAVPNRLVLIRPNVSYCTACKAHKTSTLASNGQQASPFGTQTGFYRGQTCPACGTILVTF